MRSEAPRRIESLPLPRRAINALRQGGIHTLEEALDWSDVSLLSLPQFGPAYLIALRSLAATAEH
jgi:DNA-directed RNA polymerase alpha subunit